jgi:hypothetical protein
MLVHWTSFLAAGRPELLGIQLIDLWDAWFTQSPVIVNDCSAQPIALPKR